MMKTIKFHKESPQISEFVKKGRDNKLNRQRSDRTDLQSHGKPSSLNWPLIMTVMITIIVHENLKDQ